MTLFITIFPTTDINIDNFRTTEWTQATPPSQDFQDRKPRRLAGVQSLVSSRKRAFPLCGSLAILHSFNVRKTRPVLLSISSTWRRSVSGTIAANDRGELAAQKFADKASRDPCGNLIMVITRKPWKFMMLLGWMCARARTVWKWKVVKKKNLKTFSIFPCLFFEHRRVYKQVKERILRL